MAVDLKHHCEGQRSGAPAADRQALVRSGAELVHLALETRVRLTAIALIALGAAAALSMLVADAREHVSTLAIAFAVLALLACGGGLTRTWTLYRWLSLGDARRLLPAAVASVVVLADGPYSPSWWIALALLMLQAVILASTAITLVGNLLATGAYATGILARSDPLLPDGQTKYMTVMLGLALIPIAAHIVTEALTRFTLHIHLFEHDVAASERPPIRVHAEVTPVTTPVQVDTPLQLERKQPARRPRSSSPSIASQLTARQLEVVLLARDGMLHAEIASCLGISARQVEHALARARKRVGAATTAQLVAMVVCTSPALCNRARSF